MALGEEIPIENDGTFDLDKQDSSSPAFTADFLHLRDADVHAQLHEGRVGGVDHGFTQVMFP